jgi:hypothetical protein
MTESTLQQSMLIWFNNQYCLKSILSPEKRCVVLSIPNDGKNFLEVKRKLNTGMLAGASDLVLLMPNQKTIFVEVKFGKNKQSPAQIEFQNRVNLLGFEYWLIYSLEQFQELCTKKLQLT